MYWANYILLNYFEAYHNSFLLFKASSDLRINTYLYLYYYHFVFIFSMYRFEIDVEGRRQVERNKFIKWIQGGNEVEEVQEMQEVH